MAYISQSDLGTSQLTFKNDNSTNNALTFGIDNYPGYLS